ncbi:MAG: ATP-dependent helicase HrpB [Myxococcaceae bacterium]
MAPISPLAAASLPPPQVASFQKALRAVSAKSVQSPPPRHDAASVASRPASGGTDAAVRAFDRVQTAQVQLDRILELARSGRTFSPGELLAFQTQVYRASHEVDLVGRVVEKATGGVKQVLQTQV